MAPLRAFVDALVTSLKLCAPSPAPAPAAPSAARPQPRRRIARSSSARLADLELVRSLAPALFGEVLLCVDRRSRSPVAVKRVDVASARAKRTLERGVRVAEDLERERAVHAELAAGLVDAADAQADARDPLGSRNLLLLREEVACRGSLFLVFPFCERGDLFDAVRTHRSGDGRLPERAARLYFGDVLRALLEMKRQGLAHRDISLENVMLTRQLGADLASTDEERDCCYLGDFGLAARADGPAPAGRIGKTWYMAPEVFAAEDAVDTLAADVWSLGVLLCIMLTGAPLVRVPATTDAHFRTIADGDADASEASGLRLLLRKWFPSDGELSAATRDLLASMLRVDPRKRPTLEQVASHAFFDRCVQNGDVYSVDKLGVDLETTPRRSSVGEAVARSMTRVLSKTRFSWASTSSTVSSDDLDAFLSS